MIKNSSSIKYKKRKKVANKSIHEINLREKYNLNLITIKRQYQEEINGEHQNVEHIIGVPKSDTVLLDTDIIIILGKKNHVDKFIEINK